MYYLNDAYLRQIIDSANFFKADYDFMAFFIILTTAFILGFSFLVAFLSFNRKNFIASKY